MSGAYVSFGLRAPEIEHLMETDVEQFRRFVRICDQCNDVHYIAKVLGFSDHPTWKQCVQQKWPQRKLLPVADCIVYSLDGESQFLRMQELRKKRKKHQESLKAKASSYKKDIHQTQNPAEKLRGHARYFAELREACMVEHMRAVMVPGRVYSVADGSAPAVPFAAGLAPVHRSAGACAPAALSLELDCEPEREVRPALVQGPSAANPAVVDEVAGGPIDALVPQPVAAATSDDKDAFAREQIFFRLIQANPSRKRGVPLAAASGSIMEASDMSVTVHAAVEQAGATLVSAQPRGSSQGLILRLLAADWGIVENSLQSWSSKKAMSFALRGHIFPSPAERDLCHEIIHALVRENAFPGTGRTLHVAKSNAESVYLLGKLEACDLVQRMEAPPDLTGWALTRLGAQRVDGYHRVAQPKRVFCVRSDVGLQDATPYELLTMFLEAGWAVRAPPNKKDKRALVEPHAPTSDRVVCPPLRSSVDVASLPLTLSLLLLAMTPCHLAYSLAEQMAMCACVRPASQCSQAAQQQQERPPPGTSGVPVPSGKAKAAKGPTPHASCNRKSCSRARSG